MCPQAREPSGSRDIDIAPELQGLEITRKLLDAYDQHVRDFLAHAEIYGKVPVRVLVGLGEMAFSPSVQQGIGTMGETQNSTTAPVQVRDSSKTRDQD